MVEEITKVLYLALKSPELFFSNYTPTYETDEIFRDTHRLLIFATQKSVPENTAIDIPKDTIFNMLEKRLSIYDVGLSTVLLMTICSQIIVAYYRKLTGKRVQKPVIKMMQIKKRDYESIVRPIFRNKSFPPPSNRYEVPMHKRILCYLAESVNSLPTAPYFE